MLASRVVGRDFEIGALNDALERATGGQGRVVFLVGEPGIGKSRLTQVTTATAEGNRVPVLRGRAVPAPTPLAYRPLAEALGSAGSGVVSDEPELRPFRSILGWLVPDWRGDEAGVVDTNFGSLAAPMDQKDKSWCTQGCPSFGTARWV